MDATNNRPRPGRGLLAGGALLALVGTGVALWSLPKAQHHSRGPQTVTAPQLRDAASPEALPNWFVRFKPMQIVDTGVRLTHRYKKFVTHYKVLLVAVEDRWMLAEVHESFKGDTLTGKIEDWGDNRRGEPVKDIVARLPEKYRGKMMPFQMDAHYIADSPAVVFMFSLLAVFVGLGLLAVGGLTASRQRPQWDESNMR